MLSHGLFIGVKKMGDVVNMIKAEEKYSRAVIDYFKTVYETELLKYKFIRNKVWRMRHQNPTEYKQTCDLIGVNSLFDKYQEKQPAIGSQDRNNEY